MPGNPLLSIFPRLTPMSKPIPSQPMIPIFVVNTEPLMVTLDPRRGLALTQHAPAAATYGKHRTNPIFDEFGIIELRTFCRCTPAGSLLDPWEGGQPHTIKMIGSWAPEKPESPMLALSLTLSFPSLTGRRVLQTSARGVVCAGPEGPSFSRGWLLPADIHRRPIGLHWRRPFGVSGRIGVGRWQQNGPLSMHSV